MSLSTRVKTAVMAVTLAVVGAGVVAANTYAYTCPDGHYEATAAECGMHAADTGATTKELPTIVKDIINGVLYVVGVLAVVMVIIGGVQYTTSGGDQAAVTKAKNTILYGIVGLVIAILAYAIVNFVIGQVIK